MSYLHELAEQYQSAPVDRRRAEWAQVREDIDRLLTLIGDVPLREYIAVRVIRAYHAGYKRAAALAVLKASH